MAGKITKQQLIDGSIEIAEEFGIHKLNSNTVSCYFNKPDVIVYNHFKGFDDLVTAVIKSAFKAGNLKIIAQVLSLNLDIPRGYDDVYTIEVKKIF
jgi:hypothetical protein